MIYNEGRLKNRVALTLFFILIPLKGENAEDGDEILLSNVDDPILDNIVAS